MTRDNFLKTETLLSYVCDVSVKKSYSCWMYAVRGILTL